MASQIWKFGRLTGFGSWQSIPMDEFAEIRHFGEQNGNLFFWAEVTPTAAETVREFMVIPTGFDVPEYGIYCGTLVASDMTVWHLYEKA